MRDDEARVVEAFCDYLGSEGWTVEREVNFVDIKATRGDLTLFAEAKGRTKAVGLDVDTLYGQLLRRIPDEAPDLILGVVVPDGAVNAALRVPDWVRDRLRIHVWTVSDDGQVRLASSPGDSAS